VDGARWRDGRRRREDAGARTSSVQRTRARCLFATVSGPSAVPPPRNRRSAQPCRSSSRTCEGTGPAMRAGCVLLLLVLPCALGAATPSLRHVRACPPCPLSCAFGSDLSRRRTSRPALTRAATHTMLGGSCSTARPPTPWPIGFGANLRASAREGRATTMHDTGCVFIVLHHPGLFSDLP
jgi:hypothetical protein